MEQEEIHILLARLANVQIKGERILETEIGKKWQSWAAEKRVYFLSHQTLPDGIEEGLIQAEQDLGIKY